MPAHEEEAQDAEREGVRINWLRTIKAFEGEQLQVEVMELDESGFPQPTGRFETLAADTVILALGQETDTAFLRSVPGVEFERDGTVRGLELADDRLPGRVRRRRHGARRAHGHRRRGARQAGGREIDAWLRGEQLERPPKHPLATFEMLNLWYFGDALRRRAARARAHPGASGISPRWSAGSRRRRTRRSRRGGACRAGTAASATGAWARARRTRSSSSGPGCATGSTTTAAPAAGRALSSARCTRSR